MAQTSPRVTTGNPTMLDGKRLVVIGGTSGIGLSAVQAFAAAGARVVAVGLLAEKEGAEPSELGACVRIMHRDARDPETAPKAISECVSVFGGFDGLYHVAGGSGRRWGDGPLHEVSDQAWQMTLELNLTSVFYSNRAAVRQFLAQKTGGSVLNLASVIAWSPSPYYFTTHSYAAAKAAIIGLTQASAARYAAESIRFNVLAPGLVDTPMAQRAVQNPDIMQFIHTKQPLDGGRAGRPSDLDAAAVYFMSDGSAFATGQVLAVDGGWCLSEGQIPSQL
ncbi:MAG TPA: SDR family oxidoreductase [Clostridia bacterium]|nr:SDR family oxidoreductase [Clostridia bacterium]